jgi:hypothetical protein
MVPRASQPHLAVAKDIGWGTGCTLERESQEGCVMAWVRVEDPDREVLRAMGEVDAATWD